MTLTLNLLAAFLYSLTTLLLWHRVRQGLGKPGAGAALTWLAAAVCHAAALEPVLFTGHGLNLAFFKAASLAALLVSLTLLANCLKRPLGMLGLAVLPTTVALLLAGHADSTETIVSGARTAGIQLHILSSFLAYSFLVLAGVQAVAAHLQERRLRMHHTGPLSQALPPLDAMSSLLFTLVGVGVALLTLSLVSGWLYHDQLFAQHLVHKTVLSAAAWLFFSAFLAGGRIFGWRSGTALKMVLSGVVLLVLAYFGSKLVLELVLHRV